MKRSGRLLLALALISGSAVALSSAGGAAGAAIPCATEPETPSFELVYLLRAGEEKVTARTRGRTAAILCSRLRRIGIADAEVSLRGKWRIRVVLPQRRGDDIRRVVDRLGAPGQLGFYQWEANLIGPERAIGGHPGRPPKARALARAEREWKATGRPTNRGAERRLIFAGAFPSAYGAVRLASKQAGRRRCAECSASMPHFYMFDRSPAHRLIAGPVSARAELRHVRRGSMIVLKVPVGTTIVSEQPSSGSGELLSTAKPGWFALHDRPALTAVDIVDPKQELNEIGQPNVTFGFTEKGRQAFQRVTRAIAQCGQSKALGPVTVAEAEALSCHFAVILDGEVKTRPIINFADNPDGIDGRTGAQISGGFNNIRQAQDLVAVLRAGPLPIELTLVRQLAAQNS
jgi:SecD/SecF fusion protein